MLLWHAPASSFAAGAEVRRGYYLAAGYFSFMLITYPIAWACAEGGNVITVTSEMVWFGILDLLTGPIFLVMFLYMLREGEVDYATFGLQSGKRTDTEAARTNGVTDKPANGAGHANGATQVNGNGNGHMDAPPSPNGPALGGDVTPRPENDSQSAVSPAATPNTGRAFRAERHFRETACVSCDDVQYCSSSLLFSAAFLCFYGP